MKSLHKQLTSPGIKSFEGSFKVMVKNGEVSHSHDPANDSTRPRLIFNPSDNFCGLITYL